MGSQGSLWMTFPEPVNAKGGEVERRNLGLRLVTQMNQPLGYKKVQTSVTTD
jgi:hypothetical protein